MKKKTDALFLFLSLMAVTRCSSAGLGAGAKCSSTIQCQSGLFCLTSTNTCASVACTADSDCPNSAKCESGSCGGGNSSGSSATPTILSVTVNAASGSFTIGGTNLESVTGVQLTGGSLSSPVSLTPSGATASQVVATLQQSLPLVVGQAYSLVVASAGAASLPATVTYTIPNGTVTPLMMNASGCAAGDTLVVSSGAWTCASAGGGGGGAQLPSCPAGIAIVSNGSGGWVCGNDPSVTGTMIVTADDFRAGVGSYQGTYEAVPAGGYPYALNGLQTTSTSPSYYVATIHLPDGAFPSSVSCKTPAYLNSVSQSFVPNFDIMFNGSSVNAGGNPAFPDASTTSRSQANGKLQSSLPGANAAQAKYYQILLGLQSVLTPLTSAEIDYCIVSYGFTSTR